MKRLFDFLVSFFVLVVLLPIILLVAFSIRLKLGSPIFFYQQRPGLNGDLFQMVKFRTMLDISDVDGNLLSDSARLTSFGKFLRSTSLDELPELWNVLKGEMSLVGPRPLLIEYLPLYNKQQAHRHDVKPGVTGWAQVNGRNAISWEQKFELDIWYVKNHNMLLDLKILWMTIFKVFNRAGISQDNEVTMAKFRGSDSHA